MPQLDVSTYTSQLFWLAVCFSILYWTLKNHIIPRLHQLLQKRWEHTEGMQEEAEHLQKQAEAVNQECENSLDEARERSHEIVNQATQKSHAQSKSIATELDAAKKARKEAEAFLKAAKEQKESATEQAKAILEHAKKERARLEADASKNLDELLTREKKRVEENIERLEVESTKRLQAKASELSLQATKEILATLMTDKNAQKAFDQKVLEDLKK
ncbi:uncharacterized protein LOC111320353, partial [Stylophora pistillata]|uniref:uncharacterized protein LOC111320353 n=1 Tax=Stylophora pistillata TaxID=50429 RepID=UPI000C041E40